MAYSLSQAITALKKGAQLLKYGRRGKPKFCPFKLANVRLNVSINLYLSSKKKKKLDRGYFKTT